MKRPLTFHDIERMVLAELISNEFALAIADRTPDPAGLEISDFDIPLHGWAFTELRTLQQNAERFDAMYRDGSVIVALAERIANKGQMYLGHSAAPAFEYLEKLGELVRKAPRYDSDFATTFPRHLRELRAIANQRRLLTGAA